MISFTGSTAVGKHIMAHGLRHAEAGVPRARRQVGQHRARRRRLRRRTLGRGHGVHALRPGLRDHDPLAAAARRATTRASSCVKAAFEIVPLRRPDRPRQHGRPADQRPPARARARLHREGQGRRRAAASSAAAAATQFDKGYFVQPTLFVDVDPDSTIAQEEIFGPVLVGHPVRGRRRRGAHREQLALRPVGRGHERDRSTARSASPAGSAPARSR